MQTAIIKEVDDNKCWQGCTEIGTFINCWWECKMVQPLSKSWAVSKLKLPFCTVIALLGIYAREMKISSH